MKRNFYVLIVWMLTFAFKVDAQTILSESFEGTFPPTGWTLINAGAGNSWTQNTTATYASEGTKSMQYVYSSTAAANAWAFTPALTLSNTKGYYISFYVRVRSGFPERLKFTVGNAGTVAAQTTTLIDSSNLTNTAFRKWTGSYTPTTSGSYNFAFNCYSLADEFALYVDSVTIFEGQPLASCSGTPIPGSTVTSTSFLCSSGSVALSVSGASTTPGLTYQWQSSPAGANTFINIPGATTNSYTATISSSTDFRRVTSCTGAGTSATSTIATVSISGPPTNDSFCAPIALTLNGASVCGNTTCATSGAYDPVFTNSTPNNTVWYTYTPTTTGAVQAKFKRPAGTTTGLLYGWLGIYTVSGTCPALTFTEVPSTLSYNLTTNDSVSVITPSLTAGTTYYFMIDGVSGASGAFCIQVLTPPAPPTCSTLLAPANGSTNVNNVFTLRWSRSVNASGYDVYLGTASTTIDYFDSVTDTTLTLSSLQPNTTVYWYIVPYNVTADAVGCEANVFNFTTSARPSNDSCGAAITLTQGASVNGSLTGATTSPATSVTCGSASYTAVNDVWYRITALSNGTASVSVDAAYGGFNPVIAVYSGTCSTPALISCSDAATTTTETINLTGLVAGNSYLIRVFSNGTITGPGFTITASGPALPVTGVNLTAIRNGRNVQLDWQTFTEMNNAGFELQRSADGSSFTSFLKVASKANGGNSSAAINYTANDIKPFAGANYYRLKQADKDGKISYSNVVYLKGVAVNNLTLSAIYPNPTRDVLKAAIQSPTAEKITFVISDMMGKVINRQTISVTSGDNTIHLNVTNLPSGSYLLKAICSNGCETAVQKFTKQ